jgi:putative flippase GtrA
MQKVQHHEVIRFLKFGLVGVSNTVIDFLILNFLILIGLNAYFSNAIAFLFAVTNSYLLNRAWTFKDRRSNKAWQQYTKFFIASAAGLAINLIATYFLLDFLDTHQITNRFIQANASKLIAIAVIIFWNYGMSRFFVFKDIAPA